MPLTTHCLVKNEENFIEYSLRSVMNFVERVIVFDTGSTDKTVEIVRGLATEFPDKIIFEEKGKCDKARHTDLRNEMILKTNTDWFMILDGDEVWTEIGMKEALEAIKRSESVECLIAPFHLCVGDVHYEHRSNGKINMLGKMGFHYPRFLKKIRGIHWKGVYNEDSLFDDKGKPFVVKENAYFLKNKFWHATHLRRSSLDDSDYSSGGTRKAKRVSTYFLVGKKIKERVPAVFEGRVDLKLTAFQSFVNFFPLLLSKFLNKIRV